jgi:hypothetical protein
MKLNAKQIDNIARVLGTLTASSAIGFMVGVFRPNSVTPQEEYGLIAAALSTLLGMLYILRNEK